MRKTAIVAALLAGLLVTLSACAAPAVTAKIAPATAQAIPEPVGPAPSPVEPEAVVTPEPACPTEPTVVKLGLGPWSYAAEPVKYVFEVTPASGPGSYSIKQLQIYPIEAAVGDNVTFSIWFTNTGTQPGTYTVALKFDGSVIDTQNAAIDAGNSTKVEFESMAKYGEFKVVAGELTAGLKVVF